MIVDENFMADVSFGLVYSCLSSWLSTSILLKYHKIKRLHRSLERTVCNANLRWLVPQTVSFNMSIEGSENVPCCTMFNILTIYQLVCFRIFASSQRHTLPKQENMHSISEVIILNNDKHQHKKITWTNNRINRKIKQQHTTVVDWCYCLREVLFQ